MFALQMHSAMRVTSWGEAACVLERAMKRKPLMNGGYPIPGKENNKDVSVRLSNEGIHFRYHHTDVITWHPDGSYTYDPWTSRSTCTFFNQFCPAHTHLTRNGTVLIIRNTGYAAWGEKVHVVDDVPQSGVGAFVCEVINRRGAKEVLKRTRYAEYREWHRVMSPLLTPAKNFYTDGEMLAMLEEEARWPELATARWGDGHPDKMRTLIYADNAEECYKEETFETLPSDKAQRSEYRVTRSV